MITTCYKLVVNNLEHAVGPTDILPEDSIQYVVAPKLRKRTSVDED
jgi:hypothetical protein